MVNVVLIGAIAVDFIAKVDHIPRADEIVFVKDLKIEPGGSTANIAVALSRLGVKCGFIGKIGNDMYGRFLIESLKREGVDTSRIIMAEDGPSARTFIAVSEQGEKVVFALGGRALIESIDEIDLAYLGKSRIMYIGEVPPNIGKKIIEHAKAHGVKVIYGPGVMSNMGLDYLREIISQSDIVVLSKIEFVKLLSEQVNIVDGMRKLSNLGPEVIILTLGEEGAQAYVKKTNKIVFKSAFKVKPIDTTGAGDAFTAGIIFSLLKNLSWEDSLTVGNAVATLKIQRQGPRNSPYLREVIDFLMTHGLSNLALKLRV